MEIRVENETVIAESTNFVARLEGPALVSFKDRRTNAEFCRKDTVTFPLELFYVNLQTLGKDKHHKVTAKSVSPLAARIIVEGDDSDRELLVHLDPKSGDLCVTPNGQSARQGMVSVRWNIAFDDGAAIILPCINGLLVEKDREWPGNDRFAWPFRWNAQLVIAEKDGCSMMLHCEDTACKFKALNLHRLDGASTLGFESEQVGPLWNNRNAGGTQWRLNTYDGNWKKPAGRYRRWLRATYPLEANRATRPEWVDEINFTVQWAWTNPKSLDALAKIHPPEKTLIHLAAWRTSAYDVDYPDYFPTDAAKAYMKKANEMGFKVMPHFNYFCCYNKHPLFARLRDWQIRAPYHNEPMGWYWPLDTYDQTRMAYIHPGLGLWRRILIDAVRETCRTLEAPAAFLDQTLITQNSDNAIVENMNMIEGLRQMQEEFVAIQPDMVLVGEGLNEISFQRQCFAQGHIHEAWHHPVEQYHIDAAHSICSFLWEGHTRLIGYHHLVPGQADCLIGAEIYRRMGAIPSLICNNPEQITKTEPLVKKLLEQISG